MAKNGTQATATAPATTAPPDASTPSPQHSVCVVFDLDGAPVVSVAPPQLAVNPGDTITFTLDASAPPGAKFHTDPKDASLPLVAWGGGGDWDPHVSQLKSTTWAVTWEEPESHTSFSMTSPQLGAEFEYAGVFTYTVAVEFDGHVYYVGDPTIVNEPPPLPTPLKGA